MRNARRRLVLRGHAPRIARGATPADVRWGFDDHERSELPQARIESPGTGPPGPKIGKVTS